MKLSALKSIFTALLLATASSIAAAPVTLEEVRSYAFPNELAAATTGSRIAWASNDRGQRNIWVAEGPEFVPRRLTSYMQDDGQELTSVSISRDGKYIVYVRGGDHGSNWDPRLIVNPTASPNPGKVQIYSAPFAGGEPKLLSEGDIPTVSPSGDVVAFERDRAIYTVPIDGSKPAERLFTARGDCNSPEWSPDGSKLAFVSSRGSHGFIGVYAGRNAPITWLAPSTGQDEMPRWSPDGTRVAFVRTPGSGGAPEPILGERPRPWSIWTADVASGQGRLL